MQSSDFVVHWTNNIRWLSFPILDAYDFILHGFIVKNPNYPTNRNTRGIKNFLQNITPSKRMLISLRQVHQEECVTITSGDKPKKRNKGDALLTDRKDIFLSVQVADCLPIFLVDEKRKVVGLIHAGWKGTLLGIAQSTMEEAKFQFGCEPKDFTILFGPCIQSCCYQVLDDVAVLFDRKCLKRSQNGEFTLDLICANLQQFLNCGVKQNQMFATRSCTCCEEELFHSYRREKENAGRMIGFLGLR